MSLKALLRSPATFLRHPRSTCTPRRTLLLALPSESDRRYGNGKAGSSQADPFTLPIFDIPAIDEQ